MTQHYSPYDDVFSPNDIKIAIYISAKGKLAPSYCYLHEIIVLSEFSQLRIWIQDKCFSCLKIIPSVALELGHQL